MFITLTIDSVLLSAEVMTATIKGKVTDEKNQPIEFATATLISPATKEVVKGEVCNDPSYRDWETDRKSTRLNSSHRSLSRMPSSA